MWPWGHLAGGYLLFSAWRRARHDPTPGDRETVVVAVATQLPDVVDKPLALTVSLLPGGRSLAHSLLAATIASALVWRYAANRDHQDLGTAFAVGYWSHLLADSALPALTGSHADLAFLAWPFLPLPGPTDSHSILGRFWELAVALSGGNVPPFFVAELGLVVAAAVLWTRHGAPGVRLPPRD